MNTTACVGNGRFKLPDGEMATTTVVYLFSSCAEDKVVQEHATITTFLWRDKHTTATRVRSQRSTSPPRMLKYLTRGIFVSFRSEFQPSTGAGPKTASRSQFPVPDIIAISQWNIGSAIPAISSVTAELTAVYLVLCPVQIVCDLVQVSQHAPAYAPFKNLLH